MPRTNPIVVRSEDTEATALLLDEIISTSNLKYHILQGTFYVVRRFRHLITIATMNLQGIPCVCVRVQMCPNVGKAPVWLAKLGAAAINVFMW